MPPMRSRTASKLNVRNRVRNSPPTLTGEVMAVYEKQRTAKEIVMLETIIVILVVMWLLGLVTSYTMGGLIHILLVIAVVVLLVRLIQGRRIV